MRVLDQNLTDKDVEELHKRLDRLEAVAKALQQNPAPTIPQYDLGGGED